MQEDEFQGNIIFFGKIHDFIKLLVFNTAFKIGKNN